MAEDTLRKRLEWSLELDLDDVHKEIRSLPAEFGKITSEMGNLAKSFDKGFSQITSEIKSLGQDLRSLLAPALVEIGKSARQGMGEAVKVTQQFKTEAKAVANEVNALGKAADSAFKDVVKDVNNLTRAIRQVDMSPWEKQADKYGERINAAQKRLADLYYTLQKSNLSQKERDVIENKIAETQGQILKLSQAQVKAQNLAVEAALKQKQAEQDKAVLIAQTEKARADAAAKAKADREAAIQQLKQERALIAEQKTMGRNASNQNKGVDKFDGSIKSQIAGINTILRQSGMSEWEKLADNYAQSISKAHVQIRALKASLDSVTVTEKDRIAIHQRIAESEKQIGVLTAQSAKHVDQVRKAEMERAKAVKASMQDIQGAIRDLSLGAGIIGGVLTAGIGGAVKEFGNFEEQIIKFNAVSESTPEQIEAIKKQAIELGASTKFTAQQIGAAQVELAKMGFSAGETISAMEAMTDAAIASGDPLEQVSSTIATTIRMFEMSASEAGKVADIITRGANISAQSFSSYADSMRYVGSVAHALNQPLETVAASLNILADRGIKGTQAGEHLKIALLRLATEPKPAAKAMEALGLSMFDATGKSKNFLDMIKEIKQAFADKKLTPQDQIKNIKAIFGAEAVASIQTFLTMSNKAIDEAIAKQNAYGGSTKKTADEMKKGFNYAIEEMKGALNSLQIQVGEDFAPIIKAAAGAVKEFTEFIANLPDWLRIAGEVAVGAAALIFSAFAGAGGVFFVVTQGAKAFTALGLNVAGAGTAVSTMWGVVSPILTSIGLAMAEVAAVAYVVYKAYETNFGGIKDIMRDFTDFLFGENNEGLKQWISEWDDMWAGVGQTFKGLWMGMTDTLIGFLGFMDETASAFFSMISHISKALRAAVDKDWDWFKTEAEAAATEAKQILNNLFNIEDAANADKNRRRRELAYKKYFNGGKPKEEDKPKEEGKPKKPTVTGRPDDEDKAGKTRLENLDKELQKQIALNKKRQDDRDAEIAHLEKLGLSGGSAQKSKFIGSEEALMKAVYPTMTGMGRGNKGPGTRGAHSHGYEARDVGVASGSPVLAAQAGKVIQSGWMGNYGKAVMVDHGNGLVTLYAHNSSLAKKVGDVVKQGEKIALSGSTGRSTGPHGHFEIRDTKGNQLKISNNLDKLTNGTFTPSSGGGYSKEMADEERKKANQQRLAADLIALRDYGVKLSKELSSAADAAAKAEVQTKIDQNKAAVSAKLKEIQEQGLDIAKLEKEFRDKLKKERQDEFEQAYKDAGARYAESEKQAQGHLSRLADIVGQISDYETMAANPEFGDKAQRPDAKELTDEPTYVKFINEAADGIETLRRGIDQLKEEEAGLTKKLLEENVNSKPIQEQINAIRKQIETGTAELAQAEAGLSSVFEAHDAIINEQYFDALHKAQAAFDQISTSVEEGSKELSFFKKLLEEGKVKGSELAEVLGLNAEEMQRLEINPELSQNLDTVIKKLELTGDDIARIRGKLATNDITQFLADELEKGAQKLEQFQNLLGDDDGLRELQRDLDSGKKTLSSFSKELWMSEEQTHELKKALENVKARDFADQITAVAQVLSDFGSLLSSLSSEAAEDIGIIVDGLVGMGQGIAGVISSAATGNVFGAISSGIQTISAALGTALNMFQKTNNAAQAFYETTVQLGLSKSKSAVQDAQLELDQAIYSGASPAEIARLRKNVVNEQKTDDINNAVAAFKKEMPGFGDYRDPLTGESTKDLMPRLADGTPDFEAMRKSVMENDAALRKQTNYDPRQAGAIKATTEGYLQKIKDFENAIKGIQQTALTGIQESDSEINAMLEESTQKRTDYYNNLNKEQGIENQTNDLMKMFVPNNGELQELVRPELEGIAKEMDDVFTDVVQNFNNGVLDREAMDEYDRRMATLWPKMRDRITKAVSEAQEKMLEAADKQLAENAEALKKTIKEVYDEQQAATQKNIDAEQRKIDKIERQNEKLREQINLKNELNEKDKAEFEKNDTGLFAKAVAAVNYDAELRAGLDAIHNPEGVPNQTYSDQSHLEAGKERIALLKLEAENKLNLEKYDVNDPIKNRKLYQQERLKISAIEARFAEEELKTAEVGSREYLELQEIQANAYQDYKRTQMEMLDEFTAHETEKIEESITANNKQAANYKKNIDAYKAQMDTATANLQRDIARVDKTVKDLSETNKVVANQFVVTAKDLAEGIEKPLNKMKSLYGSVRREIEGMVSAMSSAGVAPTQKVPIVLPGLGLIFQDIPGFSEGGIVPPGYPNDTFLARLSSGEEVVTPEQRRAESNAIWQKYMQPSYSSSMSRTDHRNNINFHVYDTGNPEQMKQIFMGVLKDAGLTDQASINGAYLGSLN